MSTQQTRAKTNLFIVFFIGVVLWQLAPNTNALGYAARFIGMSRAVSLMPGASPGMQSFCTIIALSAIGLYLSLIPTVRSETRRATIDVTIVLLALLLPPIVGYGEALLSHTYLTASLSPAPLAYERSSGDRMAHRTDGLADNRGIVIGWTNLESYIVIPVDLQTNVVTSSSVSFIPMDHTLIDEVTFDALHIR